jgi:Diguanylate cyclase, GGDEF domain/CHASE domain
MLRGAAVAVVVLGVVVSGLVAKGWQSTIVRQRHERLDRAAGSRTATIEGVMASYENALQAARSLWIASDSGAPRRVQRLRPQPRPGAALPRTSGHRLALATTLAGGLDLPAGEQPAVFELFVPVYRHELRLDASVAERRRSLVGWATGQFRARDFLEAAMKPWRSQASMGVELYDEAVPDAGPLASWPAGFRTRGPGVQQERFTFGGRTFVLRFGPLPGSPVLTDRNVPPPVVLVVGVALSVLFGAMLWLLAQVGALYREVRRLARTDSLTGVPNRRAWDEELPRELARAARSGQPVCVALLDLDHFKQYNDRHGHQAGDRFLKEAAAAWQAVVRRTDVVARYGGEEFAILLPDWPPRRCHGDRRAAPHRPARGHLLARGRPVGRP